MRTPTFTPYLFHRLLSLRLRGAGVLALIFLLLPQTILLKASSAGDLDTTFGGDGTVTFNPIFPDPISPGPGPQNEVQDMVVQTDGKIVVLALVANLSGFGTTAELIRFNQDGSPDGSFGQAGQRTIELTQNGTSSRPYGLAIQPDGKILVAGAAYNNEVGRETGFVARYDNSGYLDINFNPPPLGDPGPPPTPIGVVFIPYAEAARAVSVGGGKIYVTGPHVNGGGLLAGISDTGTIEFSTWSETNYWSDVKVGQNGKPVVGGFTFGSGLAIGRYNSDGSADTTFGTNGVSAVADIYASFRHMLAISDDKILVAGGGTVIVDTSYTTQMAFARLDSTGNLDSTFGSGGQIVSGIPNSDAYCVTAQPDGKFVAAGVIDNTFGLARFNQNGSLDTSFSGDGKDNTAFPPPPSTQPFIGAYGVGVSGGKIVVAGVGGEMLPSPDPQVNMYVPSIVVARYLGSSPDFGTLTLSANSVTGGASSVATITLNSPAPAGGAKVFLSSSNTSVATVPAFVTIPAGLTSKNFTVATKPVPATTSAGISATYAGSTVTTPIEVKAPELKALTITDSNYCPDCESASGTVTITGKAPAGGITVTLSSTNSAATVPATVVVPDGQTSTSFPITTSSVSATQAGTIKVTYLDKSFERALTLTPNGMKSFALSATTTAGPTPVTGTVTLTCPAPAGGYVVTLSSSLRAVARPTASSITIPAGESAGTFTVETADVLESVAVTITASVNGVNKNVRLTVN